MCNSEELKIVLKQNDTKDKSNKCILRTHLNLSDELICVLSSKYNIVTKIVDKEYFNEDIDISIENISYLNTKSTFILFSEELKRLIKQSSSQTEPREEDELMQEHIINYNKCNRCNNFLSCTCRRCNVNGINIQYNIMDNNPDVVMCITTSNLKPNAIDTLKTLAEFYKIKLVVYSETMSKTYPIVGINLDRIPLGVMTNIVAVISDGLNQLEPNT